MASILLLLFIACKEENKEVQIDNLKEVQIVDLSSYNMKIIPENPKSNDEIKLVILGDCTYNVLSGFDRKGTNIDIEKHFNSLMKWPCSMQNDTISIGKLFPDDYTVHYKLLDIANTSSPQISLSISFNLTISK